MENEVEAIAPPQLPDIGPAQPPAINYVPTTRRGDLNDSSDEEDEWDDVEDEEL